jgi:hypothetical protein
MEFNGKIAGFPESTRRKVQDALLGPKPTMQDVISRVGTGMQPAIEGMERASAPPSWSERLEAQKRRVDQEILNENKKTNQLLQKSAAGNQPMFSR